MGISSTVRRRRASGQGALRRHAELPPRCRRKARTRRRRLLRPGRGRAWGGLEGGTACGAARATLDQVDARFRGANDRWVGTRGRVRVVAYNTTRSRRRCPLIWLHRLGVAGATASPDERLLPGDRDGDEARAGDAEARVAGGDQANAPPLQEQRATIEALGRGRNRRRLRQPLLPLRASRTAARTAPSDNHYLEAGDAGGAGDVAGAGILLATDNPGMAASS